MKTRRFTTFAILTIATLAALLWSDGTQSTAAQSMGYRSAERGDLIPQFDLTDGLIAYYSFDNGTAIDNSTVVF